jgi:hypothetical protein
LRFPGNRGLKNARIWGVVNLGSIWVFGVFLEMAKRVVNVYDLVGKKSKSILQKNRMKPMCSYQSNENFASTQAISGCDPDCRKFLKFF